MTAASTPRPAVLFTIAAVLLGCLLVASPTEAKKKGGGTLDITKVANAPIPDAVALNPGPFAQFSALPSTIDAGKQFKGRRIRDVNVTVQTLGLTGVSPAGDLGAILTAPNGGTVNLFSTLFTPFPSPNPSIGPLTLSDESRLELGGGVPEDPTRLYAPWTGTATADGMLATLDNGPVSGTWTLTVQDLISGETSSLVSWRLDVATGRPFRTK
jgi:hypothetical protein